MIAKRGAGNISGWAGTWRVAEVSFITRPVSVWLDLVRALAALAVVVGHAAQLNVYTGAFPFSIALQKNAVVVFFVLSGMVIAASVDRDRRTLGHFAIARLSRIVPVAWGAIAVSLAVAALGAALPGSPLFAEDRHWASPEPILLAATFLSESYTTQFRPNAPYWSLCYEVWFYALFAAATYLRGRTRAIWLVLLGLAAGPNILLLMPAWLIGMLLVRAPAARRIGVAPALVLLCGAIAALFIVPRFAMQGFAVLGQVVPWELGYSLYAITDMLLALAVAGGLAGLRTLCGRGLTIPLRAEPAIRWAANMSFSLYLLHWPLLKLVHMAGMTAGNSPLAFAAIIAAVIAASAGFAAVTEHKRYAVRDWMERTLRRGASAPAAA